MTSATRCATGPVEAAHGHDAADATQGRIIIPMTTTTPAAKPPRSTHRARIREDGRTKAPSIPTSPCLRRIKPGLALLYPSPATGKPGTSGPTLDFTDGVRHGDIGAVLGSPYRRRQPSAGVAPRKGIDQRAVSRVESGGGEGAGLSWMQGPEATAAPPEALERGIGRVTDKNGFGFFEPVVECGGFKEGHQQTRRIDCLAPLDGAACRGAAGEVCVGDLL